MVKLKTFFQALTYDSAFWI